MTSDLKEFKVTAIENGTVIDHIPPKSVFQVIRILHLEIQPIWFFSEPILKAKSTGRKV